MPSSGAEASFLADRGSSWSLAASMEEVNELGYDLKLENNDVKRKISVMFYRIRMKRHAKSPHTEDVSIPYSW